MLRTNRASSLRAYDLPRQLTICLIRAFPDNHHPDRLLVPAEIRPNVGAALAADCTGEARLDAGKTNVVGPWLAADSLRMAALVVAAIDQKAAHTGSAHLGRGDLLGAIEHSPMIPRAQPARKSSRHRNGGEP